MPINLLIASLSSIFLVIALASRNNPDQDVIERKYDTFLMGLAVCGLIVAAVRSVLMVL